MSEHHKTDRSAAEIVAAVIRSGSLPEKGDEKDYVARIATVYEALRLVIAKPINLP